MLCRRRCHSRAVVSGASHDLSGVGRDALAVKCGRGDAALAHVDRVVGGDEAFAEQNLHAAERALFDEAAGLVDQDFVDPLRVVDEDDERAHEAVVRDGSEACVQVFEERNGFAEVYPASAEVVMQRALQAGREVPLTFLRRTNVVAVIEACAHDALAVSTSTVLSSRWRTTARICSAICSMVPG